MNDNQLIEKIRLHEKSGKIAALVVAIAVFFLSIFETPTIERAIYTLRIILISYLILLIIYCLILLIVYLKVNYFDKSENEKRK